MKITLYHVDAFTDQMFRGNPAAVCVIPDWLPIFYPQKTISEDPATGASHCLLAPYWSKRLNKIELHARQVSQRGGEMICHYHDDRVLISGKAVMYMQGMIAHEK